ncbi:hypothetical protein HZA43_05255 [Candidatus Peregrinibacteria bacterium]|nr:hypothetical protein [Candidatus Peregrinibacteria bacterium]
MDRAAAEKMGGQEDTGDSANADKKKKNGVMSGVVTQRTREGILISAKDPKTQKRIACYVRADTHSGVHCKPGDKVTVRITDTGKHDGQHRLDAELVVVA